MERAKVRFLGYNLGVGESPGIWAAGTLLFLHIFQLHFMTVL